MLDFLILALVAAIVVGIILYLRRQKKKGAACIGCPYAGQCARAKSDAGGCGRMKK